MKEQENTLFSNSVDIESNLRVFEEQNSINSSKLDSLLLLRKTSLACFAGKFQSLEERQYCKKSKISYNMHEFAEENYL